MLFRGYVLTKNKKCIEKFKDVKTLKSYEDVKSADEFAGILDENIVLIDIDDEEESEILLDIVKDKKLNCKVYKTTRGMHFYFVNDNKIKTCKTHTKLFIGLTADIKLGSRNSYSILKFEGKERKILYNNLDETGNYDTVPKILLPTKHTFNFIEMDNGSGRNQSLYNYILHLQKNGFGVEEARDCIRIINEYVMYEPLAISEVETILRDDSFLKPSFFKDKTFLFDKFAEFLISTYNIKMINDQLHTYKEGIYISGTAEIEKLMINHIDTLNKSKRNEVLEYLKLIAPKVDVSSKRYIAFKNGIFDIDTKEMIDFDANIVIQNKINHNYNEDAYDELMDRTLNKLSCHDKEIRMIIEESVGYTFFRRNELGVSLILIGDKKNGKSTFLGVLQKLLGEENISSLDLNELNMRFKTAEVYGKLANIGDDIGEEFIPDTSIFKKLVTGDRINVERKGQNPFEFNSYAKLIFSANKIPRMKDKTGAIKRRLVIIPFNATFDKNDIDFDPYIKTKLQQESSIEYLIKLGVEGLYRILNNNSFTSSEKIIRELENYDKENNPILQFFDELDMSEIINQPCKDVYLKYTTWCYENGYEKVSNRNFGIAIKKFYGVDSVNKKINGKSVKIYIKVTD